MRILYVSQFFYPERAASARRCFDFSKLWTKAGVKVDVLTGYPNFPTGNLFEGYKLSLFEQEQIDRINVYRNALIITENSNLLNRSLLYLSFMFVLIYNIAIKQKIKSSYDVVIGTSGTVFSALSAFIISCVYRGKFVVEFRDITALQILATTKKKNLYYYIIKYIELFLAKRAEVIVTVTDGYKKWLNINGIVNKRILTIPNGYDFNKISKVNYWDHRDTPQDQQHVVAYFGTLGISQDLEFWEQVFINLEHSQIKFLFIGDGARKGYIKYLKDKFDFIEYIPSIDETLLEKYYALTDLNIVSLKLSKEFEHTVPSKIFDIFAHSNPIIFHGPKNGEAARIIKQSCGGVVLHNSPVEAAVQITHFLNSSSDKIHKTGQLGYRYVLENFNRYDLAKKLLAEIRLCLDANN